MKLKKFNVILAAGALAGAAVLYGIGGYVFSQLPWFGNSQIERSITAMGTQTSIVFGNKTAFSSEGKQVETIPWQSRFGRLPENATLQKWTDGGRTYYRVIGPINPEYTNIAAGKMQDWGEFFNCEVFFQRGGGAYDQWIINPNGSMIYEYSRAATRENNRDAFSGESRLSDSRYRGSIKGDQVEITFWCDSRDTPTNIVFNYNDPKTNQLHWVTTGSHESDSKWNHHWADDWNNP